jgi:hypothetical protein
MDCWVPALSVTLIAFHVVVIFYVNNVMMDIIYLIVSVCLVLLIAKLVLMAIHVLNANSNSFYKIIKYFPILLLIILICNN